MPPNDYELGKLMGQMLQEQKDTNDHLTKINGKLAGQEKRIRTLENWKWYLLGSSIVIGTGAAGIASAFV